jgi:FAD/FMN-containing dehydrogenase
MAAIDFPGSATEHSGLRRETTLAFVASLDGSVIFPEDPGYEDAIRIWNGMIRKRPAMVVRPSGTPDVVQTVAFARDNGLELSIRGGGHNIAGLALSDGGVTLDLSGLRRVGVEVRSRRATADAGCTLGDLDRATQHHGLATALGFVSLTGLAGLTLGGGFGYLSRQFGWTVDDLEEVEIVTADGLVRRASRTAHPDLFWAIRGGGGNFGVVTQFVFRLHPLGPQVTAGLIAWPASEAAAVLDVFRRAAETAPRELTLAALMRNAPPAPWLPESAHGTPIVVIVACHTGGFEAAAADLAPIRQHGTPLADLIQVKSYVAQQSMLDATQPAGRSYYWKSEFLPGIDPAFLATYREQLDGNTSPANQIVLFQMGGAIGDLAEDDGAVGNREAAFACVIQASWPEGDPEGPAHRDWARRAWEALKSHSTGGNYVNFQTADEADDRTRRSYRGNFERLAAVKAAYDPANLFRVNRNIQG